MSDRPKVHTQDYDAVPRRWWENPYWVTPLLARVYRTQVCGRCQTPIRQHVWFVASPSTDYVFDCSVQPLDRRQS